MRHLAQTQKTQVLGCMDITVDELGYWLALYTVPRCGLRRVLKLLKTFASPKEILCASDRELIDAGVNPKLASYFRNPDWRSVELALRWAEKPQHYIIHWGDVRYPRLLREISSPPLILFMMGEPSILHQQALAIVGARYPTQTGLEIAHQFGVELTEYGFVIISGLARGIDGAAHQGALTNKGLTIAILGSGLNNIYPVCHQSLARNILEEGGGLISEFFPYVSPKAEHFPRRNRIISGLSLGVVVVEATLQSGSLITARYAIEQCREVFAIPGSIRNPLSRGCHALLKEGATLIEGCEDIMQGLSFLPEQVNNWIRDLNSTNFSKMSDFVGGKVAKEDIAFNNNDDQRQIWSRRSQQIEPITKKKDISGLDSQDKKLVECLGFEITNTDILMARMGLPIDKLLARLSILQLKGYIDVVPGGYVRK